MKNSGRKPILSIKRRTLTLTKKDTGRYQIKPLQKIPVNDIASKGKNYS